MDVLLRIAPVARAIGGLVLVLAAASGCKPMAAPMPATTLSRAPTLPEGSAGIVVAAGIGGGGVGWNEKAGGGAAAVRVGVAEDTELDLAGQVIVHSCAGCSDMPLGDRGYNLSAGGRVGVRLAIDRATSLVSGVGLATGLTGRAAGIDLGGVHDLGKYTYVSARLGAAFPVQPADYLDNDQEKVGPLTTGYGVLAAGARTTNLLGLLIEAGIVGMGTSEDGGVAAYVAIGVEQIGRLW